MKFLCPACERLAEIEKHRTQGGALLLTCAACHIESSAEIARPAPVVPAASTAAATPVTEAFAVPADRCPKCIAVRAPAATACSQCGLAFAAAGDYSPPEELAGAWTELVSRWSDRSAHEKLLTSAVVQGTLASVGRLYRLRLAQAPGDATASWGRDEVVRRASAPSLLGPVSTPPKELGDRAKWIAAAAFLVVGLILLLIVLNQLSRTKM